MRPSISERASGRNSEKVGERPYAARHARSAKKPWNSIASKNACATWARSASTHSRVVQASIGRVQ